MVAGSAVRVDRDRPDYPGDHIALARPGAAGHVAHAHSRSGDPVTPSLPAEPGACELRYVMANGTTVLATQPAEPGACDVVYVLGAEGRIIARQPLTVTGIGASVGPPGDTGAAGEVRVGWQGPGYRGDYVAVFPRDGNRHVTYAHTRTGNPVRLRLPEAPGACDLGHVMAEGAAVLVRVPVTVAP